MTEPALGTSYRDALLCARPKKNSLWGTKSSQVGKKTKNLAASCIACSEIPQISASFRFIHGARELNTLVHTTIAHMCTHTPLKGTTFRNRSVKSKISILLDDKS